MGFSDTHAGERKGRKTPSRSAGRARWPPGNRKRSRESDRDNGPRTAGFELRQGNLACAPGQGDLIQRTKVTAWIRHVLGTNRAHSKIINPMPPLHAKHKPCPRNPLKDRQLALSPVMPLVHESLGDVLASGHPIPSIILPGSQVLTIGYAQPVNHRPAVVRRPPHL